MSEIVEAENISDVSNTRNAIRKIQLKILKILDKCPVETRMMFGDGGESTITITFLEREHERERKPTGGGRGSRDNNSGYNNNMVHSASQHKSTCFTVEPKSK